jgi:hypothetical protein
LQSMPHFRDQHDVPVRTMSATRSTCDRPGQLTTVGREETGARNSSNR